MRYEVNAVMHLPVTLCSALLNIYAHRCFCLRFGDKGRSGPVSSSRLWIPICSQSYPEGCAAPSFVPCQCYTQEPLSKLERTSSHVKINVTSKSPVGDISVVTLIRTDTTLDHSQKAEKVCKSLTIIHNVVVGSERHVVFVKSVCMDRLLR